MNSYLFTAPELLPDREAEVIAWLRRDWRARHRFADAREGVRRALQRLREVREVMATYASRRG